MEKNTVVAKYIVKDSKKWFISGEAEKIKNNFSGNKNNSWKRFRELSKEPPAERRNFKINAIK